MNGYRLTRRGEIALSIVKVVGGVVWVWVLIVGLSFL